MTMSPRDKALGMDRAITRRDFLNGVALTVGAAAAGSAGLLRPGGAHAAAAYPPALTGMRGHHEGAYETMHSLRDGTFWEKAGTPQATGETYDLVVVGAGISGLAAAFLYQQQMGGKAKILILDNHDDFGGHAKRNEFTASNGRFIVGYGGSESLQTPSYFTPVVKTLLADIGIDTEKFNEYYDMKWLEDRGLGESIFFRKEEFGTDKLVVMGEKAADWVPQTPLNDTAKQNLIELIDSPPDYLAGKTREEKLDLLSKTTYASFLTDIAKYDPQLVTLYQKSTEEYFGVGIDSTTALDARGNGNPGFDGMDLGDEVYPTMSPSGRLAFTDPDEYIFHFPDGNASICRALVRKMIPAAVPGASMEDLVTARVDYGALDQPKSPVRIRLNASVVRVMHGGPVSTATSVSVSYVEGGALKTVTAGHVVLACWHRVIPLITKEVPKPQIEALRDQVKVPLIYGNVLIRSWEAFSKLGVGSFEAPGGFWHSASIDYPVSIGDYKFADQPSDPVVLHIPKIVADGSGSAARDQSTLGRYALTEMTFEDMEREVRDMLGRALGEGGFDPARDIEAITMNRWSHGYTYEYMRPWDEFWPDGPLPIEAARKGWGRIAIANADSGAYAYAHSSIDQAARAVTELLGAENSTIAAYADFPGPPRDLIGLK
jgi:spermidine dehydrogenase